jgi:hypothetical protein
MGSANLCQGDEGENIRFMGGIGKSVAKNCFILFLIWGFLGKILAQMIPFYFFLFNFICQAAIEMEG